MPARKAFIGVAATVVGLLFAVGLAQAYEWTIKGKELTGLGLSKESTSLSGKAFELSVPKLSLTIKCTSLGGTGEILTGGGSKASITFSGCAVSGAEKSCTIKSPEKSSGVLFATTSTSFLVTTVGEAPRFYDEFTPTMTIQLTGKECAFPEKTELKGTTAAKVPEFGSESSKRTQTFSKAIAEEAGVTSLAFGTNPAFLAGEIVAELAGEHKQEPQAVIGIKFDPTSLSFAGTGGGNAKTLTIHSISNIAVKIREVKITAGAFSVTNNCDMHTLFVDPRNPCTVTVTCNTKPSNGTLNVLWEVLGVMPYYNVQASLTC